MSKDKYTITIGCDLDGAAIDFHRPYVELLNVLSGGSFQAEQCTDYCYLKSLGISRDARDKAMQLLTWQQLPALVTAQQWQALREEGDRIWFITSRDHDKYHRTVYSLGPYCHNLLHEALIFSQNKSEFADKVDLMIEDRAETARQFAEAGTPAILLDAPYNRGPESEHSLIFRAQDWDEVLQHVRKLKHVLCLSELQYQLDVLRGAGVEAL